MVLPLIVLAQPKKVNNVPLPHMIIKIVILLPILAVQIRILTPQRIVTKKVNSDRTIRIKV